MKLQMSEQEALEEYFILESEIEDLEETLKTTEDVLYNLDVELIDAELDMKILSEHVQIVED